jgi:hypothetical protein
MDQKQTYIRALRRSPFVMLSTTCRRGGWYVDAVIKTLNPSPGSVAWEESKAIIMAFPYVSCTSKWRPSSTTGVVLSTKTFLRILDVRT